MMPVFETDNENTPEEDTEKNQDIRRVNVENVWQFEDCDSHEPPPPAPEIRESVKETSI